jgi:hypothetical protein
MPPAPVTYHWLEANVSIISPHTFTESHNDIILPAGHTLRRLLVAEPLFFWKRGSVSQELQEMYFINYRVTYGAAEGAPVLYRSTRTLKHVLVVDPTGVTNVYYSQWYGADLELGINERVQRGGFYSPEQRLRLSWAIYSSGVGSEILAGQANVPFRALYSTLDTP